MRLEDINRLRIDIIQSAMEVDCVKESTEDGRCVPPLDTLVLSVTSRCETGRTSLRWLSVSMLWLVHGQVEETSMLCIIVLRTGNGGTSWVAGKPPWETYLSTKITTNGSVYDIESDEGQTRRHDRSTSRVLVHV